MNGLARIKELASQLPEGEGYDQIRELVDRHHVVSQLATGATQELPDKSSYEKVRQLEATTDGIIALSTRLRTGLKHIIIDSTDGDAGPVVALFQEQLEAIKRKLEATKTMRAELKAENAGAIQAIEDEVNAQLRTLRAGMHGPVDQIISPHLSGLTEVPAQYSEATQQLAAATPPEITPYPLEIIKLNGYTLDCRREGLFSSGDIIQLEGNDTLFFVEGIDRGGDVWVRKIKPTGGFSDEVSYLRVGNDKRYLLVANWGEYEISDYKIDPKRERGNAKILTKRNDQNTRWGFPFRRTSFIDGDRSVNAVSSYPHWGKDKPVEDREGNTLYAGDLVKTHATGSKLHPHLGMVVGATVALDDLSRYKGRVWIARAREVGRYGYNQGMNAWSWEHTRSIEKVSAWGEYDLADYDFNPNERWRFAHVSHRS